MIHFCAIRNLLMLPFYHSSLSWLFGDFFCIRICARIFFGNFSENLDFFDFLLRYFIGFICNNFICSLIAMSTLYVLDWHHRTFGYMNNFQLTSETPQPEQKIGNIVQVNHGHWIPPIQPNAPPITVNCDLSSCQTYCCTDADEFYAANEYHKGVSAICHFFHLHLPFYQGFLLIISVISVLSV